MMNRYVVTLAALVGAGLATAGTARGQVGDIGIGGPPYGVGARYGTGIYEPSGYGGFFGDNWYNARDWYGDRLGSVDHYPHGYGTGYSPYQGGYFDGDIHDDYFDAPNTPADDNLYELGLGQGYATGPFSRGYYTDRWYEDDGPFESWYDGLDVSSAIAPGVGRESPLP